MNLLVRYAQTIADNCRMALSGLLQPREQVMTTVLVNVQTRNGGTRMVRARVMNNGRIVIGKDITIGNLKRGN